MFFARKTTRRETVDDVDVMVEMRELEARVARLEARSPPSCDLPLSDWRQHPRARGGSLEATLASYANAWRADREKRGRTD